MAFLKLAWAFLRRIPWQAYAAVGLVIAGLWLRSHFIGVGEERCQQRQEAAEAAAMSKAIKAGARADKAADAAVTAIKEETDHAAAEVRTIVRSIPRACPDPVLPDRVQDLGRAAVERANRAL